MMKTSDAKIHTSIDTLSFMPKATAGSRSRLKALLIGATWIAVVAPLFAVMWNTHLLPFLLPVGLVIAYSCVGVAWNIQAEQPPEVDGVVFGWEHHSHMILVQLVDDDGEALPPNIVQARLAAAEQRAEPHQIVIGVHHRLDSIDE